ncbi:hypothetical protein [Streptomyces goshikiensis]|uniref:hypothetical protein n=1 Tax=Streptomyces goshikiensis TaxID=1942 RepID=UPI0037A43543
MSEQLWGLMVETDAVRRMANELRASDLAGTTMPERAREFRLRRAALAQRHLALHPTDADGIAEAQQSAVLILGHDAVHASHRGLVPAWAPQWLRQGAAAGYVRQEAAAAGIDC